MYQNEKEETKRLQGVRKPRKNEEMAWAPPRNKSDWPGWEEATKTVEIEWRLEPEGEAEVLCRVGCGGRHFSRTWCAKANTSRQKQSSREEEERCSTRVKKLKVQQEK